MTEITLTYGVMSCEIGPKVWCDSEHALSMHKEVRMNLRRTVNGSKIDEISRLLELTQTLSKVSSASFEIAPKVWCDSEHVQGRTNESAANRQWVKN